MRQLFITAYITIMCAVIPFDAVNAQSGHAKLWNIFDKCLDFSDSEIKMSDIPNELIDAAWYVDANGVLQLYSKDEGGLFDIDGNKIDGGDAVDFFIPKPDDDNLIYCFAKSSLYYVVNLQTKNIIEKVSFLDYSLDSRHLAVHHTNCRDIWILFFLNSTVHKYLLTSEGISYKGNYQLPQKMIINLSKDCNYFTAVSDYTRHIYFGKFDRNTAEFQIISDCAEFPEEYVDLVHAIISPNMTKIYISGRYSGMRKVLFEIPIVNGIPDYEIRTEIKVYPKQVPNYGTLFYYGLDGNTYTYTIGNFGVLKTDFNGKTVFEDEILIYGDRISPSLDFVATWLSDNPCGTSPCPQMPAPKIIIEN